ncbi:MAG: nucleotide sugar dehydrogenase, partial [Caldilineaceae bacterium SB0670_bin_27]|nr:nucleotide sugar dehydrogenase [Caldilineaceae bacterium SB0670_bin_27]
MTVFDRFHNRNARVAVVGLGYVGLPLAVALAASGYEVVGIDLDPAKIEALREGRSYIADVADADLTAQASRLRATEDYATLSQCDAVSICLPTPLDSKGQPDVSSILACGREIARYLHPGLVVILESTSYPGTTTELLLPLLEAAAQPHGWRVGEQFFVAFSPERVDPGRTDWTIKTTPKIVAGVTENCLAAVHAYYGQVFDALVPVSSPSAAEMAKLFENTYRFINISLVNELLLMCDRLGLDCWEVLEAAETKPFGFTRFTPGPGVGGPCIPVDPHFLAWKMRSINATARFIELAGQINAEMPRYWVQKVQDALNDAGKAVRGSRVLVLGAAYKPDVADARESPALDILQRLLQKGAQVRYHDPYIL